MNTSFLVDGSADDRQLSLCAIQLAACSWFVSSNGVPVDSSPLRSRDRLSAHLGSLAPLGSGRL